MMDCKTISGALLAACPVTAGAASADEYTADGLYAMARELRAPGMQATFRFALMAPGMPITAVGTFKDARDVFFFVNLEPCVVQ